MAAPRVQLSGWVVLLLAAGAVAYYLYQKAQGITGEVANAVGGGLYDLLHADPVAQATGQFQIIMAALKAVGNPQVGTDKYNAVMMDNGRQDLAVQNNLTTIWPPVPSSQLPVNAS